MSTLEVNKITPVSGGSTVQVGESGDTINIPAGATLANAGSVTGLPASAINSGTLADARIPDLNASKITAGTIAAARLGSGTASSSTVLYGDGTFKAEPGGAMVLLQSVSVTGTVAVVNFNSVFSDTYTNYFFVFWNVLNGINNVPFHLRFRDTSNGTLSASVYDYVNWGSNTSGSTVVDHAADASSIVLANNMSHSGPTANKAAFTGVIYAPRVTSYNSSDNRPTINWQSAYARGGILYTNQSSGVFDNGTAVGGLQLYGDNGGGPSTYTDRFEGKIYGIVDS
jgi:hypothetical protein